MLLSQNHTGENSDWRKIRLEKSQFVVVAFSQSHWRKITLEKSQFLKVCRSLEPGETVSGCPGHQAVGREESGQDEGNQHLEDAHVMMIRMVV